jgi:hypothetical protein
VARRRDGGSGEGRWLEQEKLSEMSVCKCNSECARSSRMCSGSQRRCGRTGAGAGTLAACVAARAVAVRRGRSRGGPARGREGGGEAGEDAWKGSERRGAAGALHMAGRAAAAVERKENRGGRGWRRKTRTNL